MYPNSLHQRDDISNNEWALVMNVDTVRSALYTSRPACAGLKQSANGKVD